MTRAPSQGPRTSFGVLFWIVLGSVLSTVFLHRYVFAIYVIQGSSMTPTLNDGDTALVSMLLQRIGQPERGEIVLVRDGFKDYATKRVIGLPGERVDIKRGHVQINGRVLTESYLPKGMLTLSKCSRFQLGADQYFVMGDNRPDSYDSRSYGPISRDAIAGSYSRGFWACR